MGRLVLTRFNNITGKVEQVTLNNVGLTAQYVDNFGRYTTIIDVSPNDKYPIQDSYIITHITDQRLVEGIHYNEAEAYKQWRAKNEKKG